MYFSRAGTRAERGEYDEAVAETRAGLDRLNHELAETEVHAEPLRRHLQSRDRAVAEARPVTELREPATAPDPATEDRVDEGADAGAEKAEALPAPALGARLTVADA